MSQTPSPPPTDWPRSTWVAYADRLLEGASQWASPQGALITPRGAPGGYGPQIDGLEGFARSFLLASFRIAGERGLGVGHLLDFYARGIAAGVNPASEERWVRPDEHPQAKVEAAALAQGLDLTRPWLWDRLDQLTKARVIDYLCPVVGDKTYPKTNWLWFRVIVQTFLRSVGGPWSQQDIADDLALHDALRRADGWISDGHTRAFDHYVGWSLELDPILWSRMEGAAELAQGRTARDVEALDRYLVDALTTIGADGSPLIQGRSLIYRFAAAAPLWAGVIANVPSSSAGELRHAANRVVSHFADHGVPDDSGTLTMGWHHEWRPLAQGYSGPGSPYWAVKGLLGVALPEDHSVWGAAAGRLPVEERDVLRLVAAPGWIISGTVADGIVRICNHGTDHAEPGTLVGDSPLYARLGYSTATAPLHDRRAWREPLDQAAALIDDLGRATHRAAFDLLDLRLVDGAAVAISTSHVHWIDPHSQQVHHGSGITGAVTIAGVMTVCSLVRGPWEVRFVRVDDVAPQVSPSALRLRIGGWPLADDHLTHQVSEGRASVRHKNLASSVLALSTAADARVEFRTDASPLGPMAAVPLIESDVVLGDWQSALITLDGAGRPAGGVQVKVEPGDRISVTWHDGTTSPLTLPPPRTALVVADNPSTYPSPGFERFTKKEPNS